MFKRTERLNLPGWRDDRRQQHTEGEHEARYEEGRKNQTIEIQADHDKHSISSHWTVSLLLQTSPIHHQTPPLSHPKTHSGTILPNIYSFFRHRSTHCIWSNPWPWNQRKKNHKHRNWYDADNEKKEEIQMEWRTLYVVSTTLHNSSFTSKTEIPPFFPLQPHDKIFS